MELMTPVSMALTSFGINKFISGASHDMRFTIGQHGVTGAKSFYTREIPGEASDGGTVIGVGTTANGIVTGAADVGPPLPRCCRPAPLPTARLCQPPPTQRRDPG